jgi:tetratricopeptide (TPR) repeat protein
VIEQSRHQFRDAVTTLRRATILNPRDPQVWMTLASVYTVRGEYDEARRCCARLAPLADALTLVTTTASVTSLTGSADPSLSALEVELRRAETDSSEAMATRRVWAETLAGEIAERLGRLPVAERHFQNALHLRPSDPYALAAYADFLLNAHRFREVSDLLAKRHRLDALFLRAVEAEVSDTGSDPAQAARDTANLGARFDEMRLRGERVHMREEARFRLHSLKDPKSAATLAAQNWEVQREPADVRLLLETALATGDASMAAKAREWMGTHRTEDAVFARLDGSMIARP